MSNLHLYPAPHPHAEELVLDVISNIAAWALPSPEAFRNAIISGEGGLIVNPVLDLDKFADIEQLLRILRGTVRKGQMIDFGEVPNDVIKATSTAARAAFEGGELVHPFPSWLALSRWEGGHNGYLFMHNPVQPTSVLAVETYGVRVPPRFGLRGIDMLLIYDAVHIKVESLGNTLVIPFPESNEFSLSYTQQVNRGANSLDPLVTFLRLLADASVPVIPVPPPDKLNRARVKAGKEPLPGHTRVDASGYVTALRAHLSGGGRGGRGDGTHASPIAHWRRAHTRRLPSGLEVPVRSARVNWRSDEDLRRMFYRAPAGRPVRASGSPADGDRGPAGTSQPRNRP